MKPRIAPPTLLALFSSGPQSAGNKAHLMSPARIWNAGIVFQQFTRFCQVPAPPRRSAEGRAGEARALHPVRPLPRQNPSVTEDRLPHWRVQALAPKGSGSAGLETACGRRGDGPETHRAWLGGFEAANDARNRLTAPSPQLPPRARRCQVHKLMRPRCQNDQV